MNSRDNMAGFINSRDNMPGFWNIGVGVPNVPKILVIRADQNGSIFKIKKEL
jgi:hypothetical protein